MSYKVCVYAICKNESAFAERWMDSMKEADVVAVTDTGSADDTVEKLRSLGAEVYTAEISPWRFDEARNISLSHLPEDADICICADLDEVFEPGWRAKLEAAWTPAAARARYLFTWDFNEDGTPRKQSVKEKIHKRHGFKWVHPVHEVLEYTGNEPDNSVFVQGLTLNHYPDRNKPRTQYLPLLELSALENPTDPQTIFWLGREYSFYGKHDSCIETLKKYLALPEARWNEERSAAMRYISASLEATGRGQEAREWIYKAIAECGGVREPYLKAARMGYFQSDWPFVYAMTKAALKITAKSGSYLTESECWGFQLHDLCAISAFHLGMLEESRAEAVLALKIEPEDERLKNNLRLIESKMKAEGI